MKKKNLYRRLHSQIKELLIKSPNRISAYATMVAVLKHKIPYFSWCGFYFLEKDQLVVGPYQGVVACQTLKKNIGVCWTAANKKKAILVPDVNLFDGHIACDSRTQREVVVPIFYKSEVIAVLDVDSYLLNAFDEDDLVGLQNIVLLLENFEK